jgi:elongation factor G
MKTYQTSEIKNIALVGNSGSGKTTLAEAMLFEGGVIERKGEIENKNTVSDFNEIEQVNGSSVYSSVLYTEYANKKINIIDAPGSEDFCGGAIAAYYASDLAVILVNSQNGIEVGTEINARRLEDYNKALMFVINHLDNDKANFDKTLEGLKERFGGNAILFQYPLTTGSGFNTIIDILSMKQYKYTGNKPEISDIPASEKDRVESLRSELIEKAAEAEESLMEKFFESGTLDEAEIITGVAKGIAQRGIFPIFCVSAKKSIGIGRLLEFIANSAPSPDVVPAPKNIDDKEVVCKASGPAIAFVFKTSVEQHIGVVNYFKVLSGEINESADLVDLNNSGKERLSQLFVSAGKNRVKVPKLTAGDIGCSVKLKSTKTNHTLASSGDASKMPKMQFPEPKFRTAIKTVTEGEEEKLGEALSRMHEEDPTIIVEYSKELKQIIVHGQGEYHLNILKWHLDHVFKVATEFLAPKIPYRETITKAAQSSYRHKKQSGGAGQFGEVHLVIEPFTEGMPDPNMYKIQGKELKISVRGKEEYALAWGGKLIYYNCIVGGSIDARFMPAILKGIMEKMEEGPLTGSYARDIRVAVYDGKMHPVDSNEISFKLAGRNAFKEAFRSAGPKILEPIYDVEILVPSEAMGSVMSDLQTRRALVQGMSSERGLEKIMAKIPLAEMNKYSTSLSSLTGGRAMYNMKFAEYAAVPGEVQDTLLKAYHEDEKEE